jgi:hypothetical protein
MTTGVSPSQRGARLVVVTPSRLGQSLVAALGAAANLRDIKLGDLSALAGATGDALVVCADVGDLETQATIRMAAVLGDPERASRWVAQSSGCTDGEGLVFASGSIARALDAARHRRAPVFRETDFQADPEATLSSLLRLLDIDPDPALFESHARAFGDAVRGLVRDEGAPGGAGSMFDRALSIYGAPIPGSAPSAWWDRGLFKWGDHPEEICPPAIDVTGLPRVLAFGPWVALPAGAWRADVEFDLCEQAARRSYRVGFGADQVTSEVAVGPLQPGRNVVSITHHFDAVAHAWLGIWVARAAFHGEMRFAGATITRVEPVELEPVGSVHPGWVEVADIFD